MNYNRKIMRLELSAEKALNGGYYYAELLLPAADYELKDAMQRARAVGRENTVEVSILECDILPELQDIRLDTFSLDELNFFAKRLSSLPDEELPVFYAVTEQIFNDADENPVSIKDIINCTYGLDTVPVAHNVSNLAELGRFAFENELLSDLEGTIGFDKEALKQKMLTCVSEKYKCLGTEVTTAQSLKDTFKSASPLTAYDSALADQAVSEIHLQRNGEISLTLINGQRIGKEETA